MHGAGSDSAASTEGGPAPVKTTEPEQGAPLVIGPQGVCEEADVTGTHRSDWLGASPTGEQLSWKVVIFFPWDPEARKFKGERVFFDFEGEGLAAQSH